MRRADRLFQIVQLLRHRRVVTAAQLARELEVSERTIYRDVRDLVSSGVPIEGEAGVGYAMPRGFDLPPLMFTEEEIETLVLGARMVEAWGGEAFARRARSLLSKIDVVLPDRLKGQVGNVNLYAPGFFVKHHVTANLEPLRAGIGKCRHVRFDYENRLGETSSRQVRPLALFFWGKGWTLAAWCELREDFRAFRPDRMQSLQLQGTTFEHEEGKDLDTYLRPYREME
ncbi:MAG: DNA-binding transcriptional regulator [Planctomycetes bacterium]|nr:DNA-binding transcriptional regulator [Planctomycetota bacterium]